MGFLRSSNSPDVYLAFSSKGAHSYESVAFMHDLHSKSGPVKDVGPSRNHTVLTVNQRLVEVETISRFPLSFLSERRGLYLHLKEVSGANVVLREKRLTPTSL